jgi:hypothetical protein
LAASRVSTVSSTLPPDEPSFGPDQRLPAFARVTGRLLHRILHRLHGRCEVLIGDLEVMLLGNRFGMAQPCRYYVHREPLG